MRVALIAALVLGLTGCNKMAQKRKLVEKNTTLEKAPNCVELLKPAPVKVEPVVKHVTINIFPIQNLSISAL